MSRIKIQDLPGDMKVSRGELKRVFGGVGQVHDVMLGQYPGTLAGAGPASSSTQTIVISNPSLEEAIFFAPEDLKSG